MRPVLVRSATALALWFVVVFAVGACADAGTSIDQACKKDSDCVQTKGEPMRCVVSAGVCVGFATPLTAVDASRKADAGRDVP